MTYIHDMYLKCIITYMYAYLRCTCIYVLVVYMKYIMACDNFPESHLFYYSDPVTLFFTMDTLWKVGLDTDSTLSVAFVLECK